MLVTLYFPIVYTDCLLCALNEIQATNIFKTVNYLGIHV
jgi:hypothetical protein